MLIPMFNAQSGGNPVPLWTNPNPNSTFAAKTVTLSLSNYSHVIIYCKAYSSQSIDAVKEAYNLVPIDGSERCIIGGLVGQGYCSRRATASSSGINFGTGTVGTTSNNNACIPVQIYGINLSDL